MVKTVSIAAFVLISTFSPTQAHAICNTLPTGVGQLPARLPGEPKCEHYTRQLIWALTEGQNECVAELISFVPLSLGTSLLPLIPREVRIARAKRTLRILQQAKLPNGGEEALNFFNYIAKKNKNFTKKIDYSRFLFLIKDTSDNGALCENTSMNPPNKELMKQIVQLGEEYFK